MTNDPEETIGRFRIEGVIGRGGMAIVYQAREIGLDRLVALKVISPQLAADPDFRARFTREAQLAASLEHPNIVPIYAADDIDGSLFIAMRLVDGTDLQTYVRQDGALAIAPALDIARPIADALDAAHAGGLVHRDVKPANVLVGRPQRGQPSVIYLTDFGVVHDTSRDLTHAGAIVGTLDYMSPEQIEGRRVDGRADQYSLTCTLFEMLTGSPPFGGRAGMATMRAHVYELPPALSSRCDGISPELDAVIARGLAKDPQDRYPSCLALVAAARAALPLRSTAPPVAEQRPAPSPTIVERRPGVAEQPVEAAPARRLRGARRRPTARADRTAPAPVRPADAAAPTVRSSRPQAPPPPAPRHTRDDRRRQRTAVQLPFRRGRPLLERPPRAALVAGAGALALALVVGAVLFASTLGGGHGAVATTRRATAPTTPTTQPTVTTTPTVATTPKIRAKAGWPPELSADAIVRFARSRGRLDAEARYRLESGSRRGTVTVTQRRGKTAVDLVFADGTREWARFDTHATGAPRFERGCFRSPGTRIDCPGRTATPAAVEHLVQFVNIAVAADFDGLVATGQARSSDHGRCAVDGALLLCVQPAGIVTEASTTRSRLTLLSLTVPPPPSAIEVPHV